MRKTILISSAIIVVFVLSACFIMFNKPKEKLKDEIPINETVETENQDNNNLDDEILEEIENPTVEDPVVNEEIKKPDESKNTDTQPKNNNSNNNSNNTSSNNQSSNNPPDNPETTSPVINQTPLHSWKINDFPISKYGSQQKAFQECDNYGEINFSGNYAYFCTDVENINGLLIGYMLRLKEFNTGNDYNWR